MILNYGNPLNFTVWIAAGVVDGLLLFRRPRRAKVNVLAAVTAAAAGLVQGVSVFRVALASHSSTGGPIVAGLSPLFGLYAALIAFPLAWGFWGLIFAGEPKDRSLPAALLASMVLWMGWQQHVASQMQAASEQDPAKLRQLYGNWERMPRFQKQAFIQNPSVPLELLTDIPKREHDSWILGELAQSWRAPASLLQELAAADDKAVYCKVTWNQNTPADILADVYHRHPVDCDYNLALNRNTPLDILDVLAETKSVSPGYAKEFAGVIREAARENKTKRSRAG